MGPPTMDYTTQLWLVRLILDLLAIALMGLLITLYIRHRLNQERAATGAAMADMDKRMRAAELAVQNIYRDLTSLQNKTDAQTDMLKEIQATLRTNNDVTLAMARAYLPGMFAHPAGGMTFNGATSIAGPVVGGDAGSMQTGAMTSHLPPIETEKTE